MNEKYAINKKLCAAIGDLHYSLHVFGDELAARQGYRAHTGIDAVHYYLCEKFSWTPATVRALNTEDLRFLLEEEMSGWTHPPEARP